MVLDVTDWLLTSDEPWTRYRSLIDLGARSEDDPQVVDARDAMLHHPLIQALIAKAATWPGDVFKRHNDAKHAIYALSTLSDFGLSADDPGVRSAVEAVLAHQSPEGAFESFMNIPKAFGGTGEDGWSWIVCDAPTLLYALLGLGVRGDQVERGIDHLVGLVDDNGWRCRAAPALGRFKGPGKRTDPCPIANVYVLKALALAAERGHDELWDHAVVRAGIEVLLEHWAHQGDYKLFLFGIGTDFRKLKYPFVWYNLLHVLDVLSRYPYVRVDPRFRGMVDALVEQADADGRYTATSMYRAWKGWSFADKKTPSPWLSFLALRIYHRCGMAS